MARATRILKEQLRLVNLVLVVLDARIPASSRNPDLDTIIGTRQTILVLNKADLADRSDTQRWLDAMEKQGSKACALCATLPSTLKSLKRELAGTHRDLVSRRKEKSLAGTVLRVMVVGISNVGKSTLLNALCGGARARSGRRPGVTRGYQWVVMNENLQLQDTPGILPPKPESEHAAFGLALTGALKEEILPSDALAVRLLDYLEKKRALPFKPVDNGAPDLLEQLALSRGFLLPGGLPHRERAALTLLREFRVGKLGRFTLDPPPSPARNS